VDSPDVPPIQALERLTITSGR